MTASINDLAVAFQQFFARNTELAIEGNADLKLWQDSVDTLEADLDKIGLAKYVAFQPVDARVIKRCIDEQAQASMDMDVAIARVARKGMQAFKRDFVHFLKTNNADKHRDDPDETLVELLEKEKQ